jgi:hypothetical protein
VSTIVTPTVSACATPAPLLQDNSASIPESYQCSRSMR